MIKTNALITIFFVFQVGAQVESSWRSEKVKGLEILHPCSSSDQNNDQDCPYWEQAKRVKYEIRTLFSDPSLTTINRMWLGRNWNSSNLKKIYISENDQKRGAYFYDEGNKYHAIYLSPRMRFEEVKSMVIDFLIVENTETPKFSKMLYNRKVLFNLRLGDSYDLNKWLSNNGSLSTKKSEKNEKSKLDEWKLVLEGLHGAIESGLYPQWFTKVELRLGLCCHSVALISSNQRKAHFIDELAEAAEEDSVLKFLLRSDESSSGYVNDKGIDYAIDESFLSSIFNIQVEYKEGDGNKQSCLMSTLRKFEDSSAVTLKPYIDRLVIGSKSDMMISYSKDNEKILSLDCMDSFYRDVSYRVRLHKAKALFKQLKGLAQNEVYGEVLFYVYRESADGFDKQVDEAQRVLRTLEKIIASKSYQAQSDLDQWIGQVRVELNHEKLYLYPKFSVFSQPRKVAALYRNISLENWKDAFEVLADESVEDFYRLKRAEWFDRPKMYFRGYSKNN